MLRVKIIKNGQITHLGQFNTQSEADAWITEGSKQQWWGKPAYTEVIPATIERNVVIISPEEKDGDGNIVKPAITEIQEVIIEPEKEVRHESEFEVIVEDISQQIEHEKKIQKNLNRIQFGHRLLAEFAALNQIDLVNGDVTLTQVAEMEESLAKVQRLIMNGSLTLALDVFSKQEVPWLSETRKNEFIDKISSYLSEEVGNKIGLK
jgi:hypothetical protein